MKKLYRINTNGVGLFYVIANHPTEAEEMLTKELNDSDYGFTSQQKGYRPCIP